MKHARTYCLAMLLILTFVANAASELRQRADGFDQKFMPEEALKLYMEVERTEGPSAEVKILIARQYIYRMNGLSSKAAQTESAKTALNYAKEAVKLDPKSSDAHLSVAICLGKLTPLLGNREMNEASAQIKASAEQAAKLNPKSDFVWHLLGRWHQGVAEIGEMTRMLAKVVYGTIPRGSHEEALRCFRKALSLNPQRLIHSIELGRTYAQMGDKSKAREWLERGLAMPNRDFDDPESKERGRAALERLN